MDMTGVLTIGLVLVVLGWMIWNQRASGRMVGKSADRLRQEIPALEESDRALVYCFSPNCPPCRNMMPHIDQLAEETGRVFKLDITSHMDLAREIGIRATPTLLLVVEGEIRKVLVGAKPPAQLRDLLQGST